MGRERSVRAANLFLGQKKRQFVRHKLSMVQEVPLIRYGAGALSIVHSAYFVRSVGWKKAWYVLAIRVVGKTTPTLYLSLGEVG